MALAGCRLDVVAELDVQPDGGGEVSLTFVLDAALLAELDALEVDPTAELTAAAAAVPGWELDRRVADDGGLEVALTRHASTTAELVGELRALTEALDESDPALVVHLDLELGADGMVRLDGEGGLRPPVTAGASIDGVPIGPAGEELTALVRRSVHPRLVVTLPGRIAAHDADRVEGSTLTWQLPVGSMRTLAASAESSRRLPAGPTPVAPIVLAGLGLMGLVALLAGWRHRSRSH